MNIFNNISDISIVKGVKSIKRTDIASGRKQAEEFILKQAKLFLLIIICTFLYMDNRMVCEKMLRKISQLNKELADVKYIATITETQVLEAGRVPEIEKMIKQKNINLIAPQIPPFRVELKK